MTIRAVTMGLLTLGANGAPLCPDGTIVGRNDLPLFPSMGLPYPVTGDRTKDEPCNIVNLPDGGSRETCEWVNLFGTEQKSSIINTKNAAGVAQTVEATNSKGRSTYTLLPGGDSQYCKTFSPNPKLET